MATGDVMLTLTPLQYAEYTALRARLAEAERERDYWRKEFRDVVDAGVEAIRAVQEERDRYRAALVEYADPLNWMARDYDGDYDGEDDGEERNWIGPHEGLILAAVALAGRTEGEAK